MAARKKRQGRKKQIQKILGDLYYSPNQPAAFGGARKLVQAATKYGIKKATVLKWLEAQGSYSIHKPIARTFKENRVIVNGKDEQWQADLVDVQRLSKSNKGYKHILTCIDVLSKYAWAIPLKNKTGTSLINAFKKIFKDKRKPEKLQTDKGTEFTNKLFQKFLKDNNIHFFVTYNETKAQIAERFNRTLKTKMWRYFSFANTYRYIDILQALVDGYNNSHHRSINMKPINVNVFDAQDVWQTLYKKGKKRPVRYKFKVGDQVRISKFKRTFVKGYLPNWTEEVFTIAQKIPRFPPVYRIKEYDGTLITGTFYEKELQKVTQKNTDLFRIERIVKSRGRGKTKEYLIHWRGWPTKYNSWIPASTLR